VDFIIPKEPPESPFYNRITAKDFIIPKDLVQYLFPIYDGKTTQPFDIYLLPTDGLCVCTGFPYRLVLLPTASLAVGKNKSHNLFLKSLFF